MLRADITLRLTLSITGALQNCALHLQQSSDQQKSIGELVI